MSFVARPSDKLTIEPGVSGRPGASREADVLYIRYEGHDTLILRMDEAEALAAVLPGVVHGMRFDRAVAECLHRD